MWTTLLHVHELYTELLHSTRTRANSRAAAREARTAAFPPLAQRDLSENHPPPSP